MKQYSTYELYNGHPRWPCTLNLTDVEVETMKHFRKDTDGRCYLSSGMLERIKPNNLVMCLMISAAMFTGSKYVVDIKTPWGSLL